MLVQLFGWEELSIKISLSPQSPLKLNKKKCTENSKPDSYRVASQQLLHSYHKLVASLHLWENWLFREKLFILFLSRIDGK